MFRISFHNHKPYTKMENEKIDWKKDPISPVAKEILLRIMSSLTDEAFRFCWMSVHLLLK